MKGETRVGIVAQHYLHACNLQYRRKDEGRGEGEEGARAQRQA